MIRNVLILEDKQCHREALCKILSELEKDIVIFEAENVEEAFQITMKKHIHLFLIDIILCPEQQGDVEGLLFAQKIREIQTYQFTPIIFVTSLEDPKLYSYSHLHCWGYIEKPFDVEKVKQTIMEALKFPIDDDMERSVYFRKNGIIFAKKVKDIIYIENERRKIIIHCKDDVLDIPYKTCDEILEELDSKIFIRCSRFAIINKAYIEKIDYTNRYIKLKYIDNPVEIGIAMKNKIRESVEQNN